MQSSLVATALLAASLVALPQPSAAQSLRGSHASVSLMYRRAVRGGLDFYETSSDVKRAVIRGELVSLNGNAHYRLADIGMPYVRPETKAFVLGLAADYHRACGAPLVITSATRPISRRLANSSELSVHPTGMAVDLRKPAGRCRTWLRRRLLTAERRGVIEATEERHPPHFHVAVLPSRYERVASARSKSGSAERSRGGR
ncbi:MAG TPA: DUF5715 family protein [Gemmatimonadaceae bacterium]|jgi:hypothetical protein|nr:DUF5715 family protein [Gemmatimonadaceae bacterium]